MSESISNTVKSYTYKIKDKNISSLMDMYENLYKIIKQNEDAIAVLGKNAITGKFKMGHNNDKIKLEELKTQIYKIQNRCNHSFSQDFEDEHSTHYTCTLCGASKVER